MQRHEAANRAVRGYRWTAVARRDTYPRDRTMDSHDNPSLWVKATVLTVKCRRRSRLRMSIGLRTLQIEVHGLASPAMLIVECRTRATISVILILHCW